MKVLHFNISESKVSVFSTYEKAKQSFIADFKKHFGDKDCEKAIYEQQFQASDGLHFLREEIVNEDVPNKIYVRFENNDLDKMEIFWRSKDMPKAFNDVVHNRVLLLHIDNE